MAGMTQTEDLILHPGVIQAVTMSLFTHTHIYTHICSSLAQKHFIFHTSRVLSPFAISENVLQTFIKTRDGRLVFSAPRLKGHFTLIIKETLHTPISSQSSQFAPQAHRRSPCSSLSVVVCELPLLQRVALLARLEAKRVAPRLRLQTHVMGHELRDEVRRLGDKAGS